MIILTTTGIGEEAEEVVNKVTDNLNQEANIFKSYFQGKLPELATFGIKVILALVFFFIGRIIIKCICNLTQKSLVRSSADKGVEQFVNSLVKTTLYILLVIVLVTNLGVETTSIAALVASGGVAIGLALQGSLSNFAGGVLILLLKPFVVGDYIIEDSHGNEGTVKEIQMFYTKLSTVDNKTVVIPNGTLANSSLTNVTARDIRQLDLQITISYHADLKKAKQVIEQVLVSNESVIKNEEHQVFVSDLAPAGVIIGARGWIKTEQFSGVRWQILEDIKLSLELAEISLSERRNAPEN